MVGEDVDGRFRDEIIAVVFAGPGAAVIDRAAGTGGEVADAIDLGVGQLIPRHRGIGFLGADDVEKAGGVPEFAACQRGLWQQGFIEQGATGGLRP